MKSDENIKNDKFFRLTTVIGLIIAILTPTLFSIFSNKQNSKLALQAQEELQSTQSEFNQNLFQTQSAFQNQLLATQVELENLYSYANIIVENIKVHVWDATGAFRITNLGPSNSNNLWVTIHLAHLNDFWNNSINGISDFSLEFYPSIYKNEVSISKNKSFYDTIDEEIDNEYLILIGELPSNSSITINMNRSNIESKVFNFSNLLIISDDVPLTLIDEWELDMPFEEYFYLAKFNITVGCDNCSNIVGIDNFVVSAFNNLSISKDEVKNVMLYEKNNIAYNINYNVIYPPDVVSIKPFKDLFLSFHDKYNQDGFERILSLREIED